MRSSSQALKHSKPLPSLALASGHVTEELTDSEEGRGDGISLGFPEGARDARRQDERVGVIALARRDERARAQGVTRPSVVTRKRQRDC